MMVKGGRLSFRKGLYRLRFSVKQSNLLVVSDRLMAIEKAVESVLHHRNLLEDYIHKNPAYLFALLPIRVREETPKIVRLAAEAGEQAGVGPMAAIPGALAELMVEDMKPYSLSVSMVENGGEIAANSKIPLNVGVYAGFSPVSGKIGFRLEREDFPVGLATSSATVSHALSFGEADSVIVFSDSASLSDAAATAIGNIVRGKDVEGSVQRGLEKAEGICGLRGVMVVRGKYVGVVGKLPKMLVLDGDFRGMFEASNMVFL